MSPPRRAVGPQVLTSLNDDLFGNRTLGNVRELTWKSAHDQREIQGWVINPPDFDANKKYPMILEIHGGPFAAYGPNYASELQLHAAAGYIVLYTNPRGSTSYGEEFGNLIHHAYPGNDYDDLMSGVDALIAQGNVDAEQPVRHRRLRRRRAHGLDRRQDRSLPRGGGCQAGDQLVELRSDSGREHFLLQVLVRAQPWEKPEEYWKRSPLSLVGNVKTPTMLITGEADYRTPIEESEQYYQALKLRKIDTLMVRIPEASHGGMVARPSNLIAKVDNILAWFERYRKK